MTSVPQKLLVAMRIFMTKFNLPLIRLVPFCLEHPLYPPSTPQKSLIIIIIWVHTTSYTTCSEFLLDTCRKSDKFVIPISEMTALFQVRSLVHTLAGWLIR